MARRALLASLLCVAACGGVTYAQDAAPVVDVASRYAVSAPVADVRQLSPEDREIILVVIRTTLTEQRVRFRGAHFDDGGAHVVVLAGDDVRSLVHELISPLFATPQVVHVEHPGRSPAAVDEVLAYQLQPHLLQPGGSIDHERVWAAMIAAARTPECALDLDVESQRLELGGLRREIRSHDRSGSSALGISGTRRVYKSNVRLALVDVGADGSRGVGDAIQVSVDHNLWWRRESDPTWNAVPGSETPIGPRFERSAPPTVRGCIGALSRSIRR